MFGAGESSGGALPQQLIFENVSPATRLLEKRRQMYEVQDALDNQKAQYAREEEKFKVKEGELRRKDLHLQTQLIRFNKFLQDNEAKRRRAETRAAEEAAQIKQREEEIAVLEKQLAEEQKLREDLEADVKRNMKYEEFLEKVKEHSEEYAEVTDLIARYDTLSDANGDLRHQQGIYEGRNEELRTEYQTYTKQMQLTSLAMTTEIAEKQHELEFVEKERLECERVAEHQLQEETETALYLGKLIASVENIFQRCTVKRPNIQHKNDIDVISATIKEEGEEADAAASSMQVLRERKMETIKKIGVISSYMVDLKELVEQVKREEVGKQAVPEEHDDMRPQVVTVPDPWKVLEMSKAEWVASRGEHHKNKASGTSSANVTQRQ